MQHIVRIRYLSSNLINQSPSSWGCSFQLYSNTDLNRATTPVHTMKSDPWWVFLLHKDCHFITWNHSKYQPSSKLSRLSPTWDLLRNGNAECDVQISGVKKNKGSSTQMESALHFSDKCNTFFTRLVVSANIGNSGSTQESQKWTMFETWEIELTCS